MLILGLDVSTKTGVCLIKVEEETVTPILVAEVVGKGKGILRARDIRNRVQEVLTGHIPDLVIFENYAYGNLYTLVLLVEIATLLRDWIEECGYPQISVAPTSLKKFITGVGVAKKDRMMLEVYKRWGFEGTDNEVDAFSLAIFGAAYKGEIGVDKIRMAAVLKVRERLLFNH